MKNLKNIRTVAFIAWILIVAVVLFFMPDLDELVREKGQLEVPSSAESEKASKLLNEMTSGGEKAYDFVVVFHDEDGLSASQLAEIDAVVENYNQHKEQYGITKILAHTQSEQTAKQLVSEDGTTILTQISINEDVGQIHDISAKIYEETTIKDVETYVTGASMVTEDFSTSTQEGVKKTEIIAVIFIILVLLLIFKSPIIPIISLISVGVSYLVSLGIIALLVDHYDLPFSNFTQVFLVVILFGIGTDYNNATSYTITKNGVTITVTQGIVGTYNNEKHYRIYKNQTLTITSTVGNITGVEFTCTANGDTKYGPGGFTVSTGEYGHTGGAVGTWTGSASEIVFTASVNQVRASQIVVATESATNE